MVQPEVSRLTPDFASSWQRWYPDAPPLGFLLRDAYPDRWLRVHSLPDSKRYPSSGWDFAELLRRHNDVATYVLGLDSECAVVLYAPCKSTTEESQTELAVLGGDGLRYIAQLPSELWDEDVGVFIEPMCLFGASARWRAGAYDGFICAVADEKVAGLMVELTRGRVYAPYDGGADLIFTTETERDLARRRYRAWLSGRADGL